MAYPTHGFEYHERQSWKVPCRAGTAGNVTIATALNAGDTIDGVTLAAGDRVLVMAQTAPEENGIYVVGASPARAIDFVSSVEIVGAAVVVTEGTANGGKAWLCDTPAPITVDTDPITFTGLGTGVGGGTLEDVLTAGNDPNGIPIQGSAVDAVTPAFIEIEAEPGGGEGADIRIFGGGGDTGTRGGFIDLQAGRGDDTGGIRATGAEVLIEGGQSSGAGGGANVSGGFAKLGSNEQGGDVWLEPGGGDGSGRDGLVFLNLPTSDPGVSGALWNDTGTVKVSP